jgi:hypothetical protein
VWSISSPLNAAPRSDVESCESHLNAISVAERVPLGLLYAIALTETGAGGYLNANALNIEGQSFVGETQSEAMAAFMAARKHGKDLVDIGCMQINFRYHHDGFAKTADMLDPKINVTYAARFLKSLRRKHGSWTIAVARYHAGPKNLPAQRRYVCRVLRNLVATGFGDWTAEALSYCRSNK